MKFTKALNKNHLFKSLYHSGKNQTSPYFAVYCRKHKGKDTRLGITVGVKLGNAVTRNKVRRRITAIYRTHEEDFLQGYYIVVVARNRCATAEYQQMEQSLLLLFDQLELSKNPKHPPKFNQGRSPHQRKKQNPQGNKPRAKKENP